MEITGIQTLAAALNLTPWQFTILICLGGLVATIVAVVVCIHMTAPTPPPEGWPTDPQPQTLSPKPGRKAA